MNHGGAPEVEHTSLQQPVCKSDIMSSQMHLKYYIYNSNNNYAASEPVEFGEHPSSFGVPKRSLNGELAELKIVFEMLAALKLRFSLVPINVSLADKNYLTLDNDLISTWQRALVETLLITI